MVSGINKILAVIPIRIIKNSCTAAIQLQWLNKTGAMLNMDTAWDIDSPFTIDSIDPAPFDIKIGARRSRGSWC